MSYRPKIKNNASGALTDLALDAETINGITSADIVTKTLLNSGLTTGGNIIFNDRLIVNATSDLVGDLYIGQWNHSGGSITPGSNQASLRVNGTLTTTGEINTNGHSISVGAINCDEIEAGISTVYCGNIFCGEINGSTAYLGNTSLSSLSVNGTTSLSGNITCNGTFNGNDASYSGSVTVSGTLRANNDLKTQSVYPSTTNSKSLGKSNYLYKHSYITEMHTDKITSLTNTETYIDPTTGEPATRNVFVTMPLVSGVITTDESLATVAKTGSYNDLTNKPTIPTVNNATLTIQKNGTTVNTFTANASSNVTANITVPTKVSDLANDSGFITGVAWGDVTGKPTFATVATSGSYSDLSNKPTIPATNVIPATTIANKLLVSTTTSGTSKWSDFSSAGFLKTNASGVISVDTNSYLTTSGTAANSSKLGNVAASNYIQKSNTAGLVKNDGTIDTTAYSTFTGYTSTNKLSTNYINNVAGWTSNVGTVTSVNNVSPVNGNVTLSIPSEVTESTVSGWGFTKNAGTVTSVRVQAGTGLSSSTSTAQTSTLNTTISIASGYKLPTTTEWAGKQDADADLTAIAALTGTSGLLKKTAANTWALDTNSYLTATGITYDSNDNLSVSVDMYMNKWSIYDIYDMSFANGESIGSDMELNYNGTSAYFENVGVSNNHFDFDYVTVDNVNYPRLEYIRNNTNTTFDFRPDGLYLDSTKVTFALGTTATTAAAGNHTHGNITNTGTITSTAVTSATGVLVYDSSNKIQRATAANARSIIGAAPTSHASTATTYGVGTSSSYGHVKVISGDLNGKSATNGYAASQSHTHSQYQATLVSGTNIKTINNQSLLGSGNINISGGSSNYIHHAILWYGTISGTYFQGRLNIWDENRTTAWTNSASDKDDLMDNLASWINSNQVIVQGIVRISNVDYPIINYSAGEYEDDDGNVYYTLDFLYMYSGQYRSVRLDTGVNTTYTATTLLDTIID